MFVPDNPRLAAIKALLDSEDYAQAAAAAQSLLSLLDPAQARDRADACFCLAYALMQLNDSGGSLEHWEAARDMYSALDDSEWELRAEASRARVFERVGDFESCQHIAGRVIEQAQREGFAYPLNYARLVLGYCFQRARDYESAEPLFVAAEAYFSANHDELLVLRCWEGLAWVLNARSCRAEARQIEERIITLQLSRQQPIALATSLLTIGFGAWMDGDLERMRTLMEEILVIASAHRHERLLTSTHNNLAIINVELGKWEAVRRHASLSLLHAGRSGDHRRPPLAYCLQMHLALYESRPADAVHYADEAVFALREHSSMEAQQFARWRPVAHLAAGDLLHAREMWNTVPPPAPGLEQIIQQRWMLRTLQFIQSRRFRPEPPLSEECCDEAARWAAHIQEWLDRAVDDSVPALWRSY